MRASVTLTEERKLSLEGLESEKAGEPAQAPEPEPERLGEAGARRAFPSCLYF